MKKYVWQFSINLPGGNFCVVTAEVPQGEKDIYDKFNAPKRKFWTSWRLFKTKRNADKYMSRIYKQQRNENLNEELVARKIFTLN